MHMKADIPAPRAVREFWAVTDYGVEKVAALECPKTPGVWWCPSVGYSLTEGVHLFTSEQTALLRALKNARKEYAEIGSRIDKLVSLLVNP